MHRKYITSSIIGKLFSMPLDGVNFFCVRVFLKKCNDLYTHCEVPQLHTSQRDICLSECSSVSNSCTSVCLCVCVCAYLGL